MTASTRPESAAEASRADDLAQGGEVVAPPAPGDLLAGLAAALGQGRALARESVRLGAELVRIATGRSEVAPERGDRRFADPAWADNPVYHRVGQSYLASARALAGLTDALDGGTPHRTVAQARFATTVLASALAPTNFLPTNPAALKHAFDTGGASLLRGLRNFAGDLRHNGGMPSMVERDAFTVGRELALSPGAVIERTPVAELIQYTPVTGTVAQRPVVIVPPPIGRFYFLDLRPGRSFVEYLVGQGLQVFVLSWRNPTPAEGDWDLDTYAGRVLDAIDTVREVSGAEDVNLMGFCAGGIIATTALNRLAATGDGRVHTMSYAVTLLDFAEPAPIAAFSSPALLRFASARSGRAGIITSRQMGAAFTWMRPDDLVFNYWVNNYLMGKPPPAFDVLAWNADGTNLPGALHGQFLDVFRDNTLVEPGAMTVLGSPVDLARITVPMFVTGALTDHLTPWKGCYRTTQLLGGDPTFVLSYSGHIASLVNPPGNPKAHYWTGGRPGPDPQRWRAGATRHEGSWWEAWVAWVRPRSGTERPAPEQLGSTAYPPQDPAPGRYVRDLAP